MMVGRTGAPTSHASTQFLNGVLSRRGPDALPYAEDDKWSIRQHLLNVIQECPSLTVKTAVFSHIDGRTINVLQAEGTIPIYYHSVKYNIPIVIWLLETYPRQPPLVYVMPTRDMIIKPRHPNVDASGMVNSPYIQNWVFPRSNLVELVQNLCNLFGQDPPLFSRQPAPVNVRPPPPPTSHPPPFINPIHTGGSMQMNPSSPGPSPSQSPRLALTYPPYQHTPPPPPHSRSDDPREDYKRNLVDALSKRVGIDINKMMVERNNEMETIFNTQAVLAQRAEQLKNGVRELVEEKGALENQLQATLTNTEILENWLKANDKGITHVDIDDVFEPVDALSKQLLECQASDLAIEDILYAVDKGAQELVIPVETYLKHVRVLAREQFFHRATAQRIRQMQMSSQVENMAARAPYIS
ncbi:hypothetical protein M758_5G175900 [Ceratodon purpureus]|uniref:Uncharacterized protein n=1 Tax=Ceratodon purpureus TaxID=3225 RepID=A0A8T0I4H8_CERPU|nr:hypothetical protein KC19_5G182900 [Ceratodon purpureus]KAG0617242.1 hypothetical protein M758_5G175900 [Ceratodon purpureus]KAG0617243.1 hypothetical protein M758_5G175900 [Ceratodon purpureus]